MVLRRTLGAYGKYTAQSTRRRGLGHHCCRDCGPRLPQLPCAIPYGMYAGPGLTPAYLKA